MGRTTTDLAGYLRSQVVDMKTGRFTPQFARFLTELIHRIDVTLPDTLLEIISAYTFTDNDPGAGSVSWANIVLTYGGTKYTITDDDTSLEWIYWDSADPLVFQTSASFPTPSDTIIPIARNVSGTVSELWSPTDKAALDRFIYEGVLSKDIGDPSSPHFSIGDLTVDGLWHDLDLSGVVLLPNQLLVIRVYINISLDGGHIFAVRKKGVTNNYNRDEIRVYTVAETPQWRTFIVRCDSDRLIQYLASGSNFATIEITVADISR